MMSQNLAYEAFGSFQVSLFTQQELDRIAIAVDGAIKIKPLAFDSYVGLILVPLSCGLTLFLIEPLQQFGAEMQNPTMRYRMIQRDAALRHHLLQIAQAQIVSKVPSNT